MLLVKYRLYSITKIKDKKGNLIVWIYRGIRVKKDQELGQKQSLY